ncbi:Pycsar system effector family protein [Streptomyces sp. NPDC046925]|uniref:Pycsar system effector family protein n=1 Tax=Streptomyces sp. NPDC046925 TaxID=3155375 RepID=UPI0033C4314B
MTTVGDPRTHAGAQLLADLRTEIARADSKATVLVGALSMSTGLLGGLLASRSWTPSLLSAPAGVLWWAGVTSLAGALISLLLAVIPRYRRSRWRSGEPLTYFGDVHRAARAGQLDAALAEAGLDPMRGLLPTLTETSRIAARKHLWIRIGLIAFGCASLLLTGSLLID